MRSHGGSHEFQGRPDKAPKNRTTAAVTLAVLGFLFPTPNLAIVRIRNFSDVRKATLRKYAGRCVYLRQRVCDDLLHVAGLPESVRRTGQRVEEAVQLAKQIDAKLVIPHHYNMFTFNTEDPEKFVQIAKKARQHYRVLKCGQRWSND